MADFCRACSIELFGEDFKELAGLVSLEACTNGFVATVICEGCGFIQVDHKGNCVSNDCMCKGQVGHGLNLNKE